MALYRSRAEAGQRLAEHIAKLHLSDAVVLALPRGGAPVAFEVARALKVPLDVLVVQKLASPTQSGVSLGAIAEGGIGYIDQRVALEGGTTQPEVEAIAEAEMREVRRRVDMWRGAWPPHPVADKVAILVDDGMISGGKMRAAIVALQPRSPSGILLAVPVAPLSTLQQMAGEVDGIVCLKPETVLPPLGEIYDELDIVTDHDVAALLERAQAWTAASEPQLSV